MARAAEVVTLAVWPAAAVAVRAAPPSESSSPVPPSRLANPAGSAATILSFWLERRLGDGAGIKGTRALLLADGAHDNRGQHSQQRSTRVLAKPCILANRTGECGLVPAAQQRREYLRSLLNERGLARGADHLGKAAEGAGLLPYGVDELLRPAGLRGNATEARQQPRYRRADSGLRVGAIKTECRRDASDHIGCQELHNERDEIDGHGASPLPLNWEQTFPSGMRVSPRRKASADVAPDHFPEAITNQ